MSWTTSFVTYMTDNLDNLRRCQDLGNAFRACETKDQVHRLMNRNRYFMESNTWLYSTARLALKRIARIQREKNKTWEKNLN